MTRHMQAIINTHKARPTRDSDKLALSIEILFQKLSEIQGIHNVQETWKLAAKAKREVEDLFGVEKK